MATWRERRAWRCEFKSLGIRQVKEREAHSIWHEEKQQAARRWLRSFEKFLRAQQGLEFLHSQLGCVKTHTDPKPTLGTLSKTAR
jgi:hypothetical protein